MKFRFAEDAAEAKHQLDHQVIGGREIRVVFAEENRKTPQEMRRMSRVRCNIVVLCCSFEASQLLLLLCSNFVQVLTLLFFCVFSGRESYGRRSRSRSPRRRYRC